ncbi:hypothetical protein AOLI_G00103830 [Acnodon oligacanthus]
MIYTYFISAYLYRTATSDPGCVSNVTDIKDWTEKNIGMLFTKFSSQGSLSPTQIAEFAVLFATQNNTKMIDMLFSCLEEGDALQSTAEFLVALAQNSKASIRNPVVRNIMMKRTFDIISSHFSIFSKAAWIDWFGSKLVPLLPSLTAEMLTTMMSRVDCEIYHVM